MPDRPRSMNAGRTLVLATAAVLLVGTAAAAGVETTRTLELRDARGSEPVGPSPEFLQRETEIAAWKRALAADSVSAISLAHLAALHMQRGRETGSDADYAAAGQYATQSLALRVRHNAPAYATLAASLLAQHRFSEAESAASEALALDPGNHRYLGLLADARLERGDYAGARPLFESLYSFRRTLTVAPRAARWAELNGNPAEARRLLRHAVSVATTRGDLPAEQRAWFHLRLADLEMRTGHNRSAQRELRAGLAVHPGSHRIVVALGRLALMNDDPQLAIEYAERALQLRMDPAAFGILADAHHALGDTAQAGEAIAAFDAAVRGQSGPYHREWSLFLLDHGRRITEVHERAMAELATRQDIYGHDVVAWALFRLRRYDEAAAHMRDALVLGTQDPVLYYHAGMIEAARGNRQRAVELLRAALELNERFDIRHAKVASAQLEALQ